MRYFERIVLHKLKKFDSESAQRGDAMPGQWLTLLMRRAIENEAWQSTQSYCVLPCWRD